MALTKDAPVQAREKLWRDVLNALPLGVALIRPDGRFEAINDAGRRLRGMLAVDGAATAERTALVGRVLRGETILDREVTTNGPDGTTRTLTGSLIPLRGEDGTPAGAVALLSDITERTRAEAKLRDSQARLQRIFDNEPECVKVLTRDARVLEMNPAGLVMLGAASMENVIGVSVLALVHPADRRAYAASHRAVMRGERTILEFRMLDLKGTLHWMEQHAVPLPTEDGACVLSVTRDITGRKELEAQLQQAQRLESVGRLAGGIAHDFNNLLTVIIGCSELALAAGNGVDATEEWQETLSAARRAAELTSQLLAFARQQPIVPRIVDLNTIVRSVDGLLRRVIGEHVRLALEVHADPLPVNIDRGQFEQIIVNLAVNARDSMPAGGTVRVSTGVRDVSEAEARQTIGLHAGMNAQLIVSDTGVGIPLSLRERIFDPFFTTKGPGRGTGLGLSMCYGVVSQAGGTIEVDSTVGVGSRFVVSLPLVPGDFTPPTPLLATVDQPADGAHILVVEDEHAVAELTRRSLEFGGYRVTLARNGVEAMDVLEDRGKEFALLLTDVVMPDMRGTTLAQHVREEMPDMRVIFMSGYPGSLEKEFPGARLLQKPFTPKDLLRHIADAMRK